MMNYFNTLYIKTRHHISHGHLTLTLTLTLTLPSHPFQLCERGMKIEASASLVKLYLESELYLLGYVIFFSPTWFNMERTKCLLCHKNVWARKLFPTHIGWQKGILASFSIKPWLCLVWYNKFCKEYNRD